MDFVNRSTTTAPWGLVTSAAARAKLRERAGELKSDKTEGETEHLSVRPQRLRWSGRNRA